MAFRVQSTVMAGTSAIEVAMTGAISGISSAGASIFGAVKALFEGIVQIVAAQHKATVNILNGWQLPDLPFKNELDLQATQAVREFARLRNEAKAPKAYNQVVEPGFWASAREILKSKGFKRLALACGVLLVVFVIGNYSLKRIKWPQ